MSEKVTLTKSHEAARKAILKAVNVIYDAVRLTLGPAGGNAIMYRTYGRSPRITNDGHTIADVIVLKDPFERLAAETFKEAIKRTNERVGDGTTTTGVIGGKLINDVFAKLGSHVPVVKIGGPNAGGVIALKNEMIETSKKVAEEIAKVSKKITSLEELEKIAIVSVEDVTLGKTVAKMVYELGLDGFVDVVEGFKGVIETEVIKGMRFPAKVAAHAFVNRPERYEMVAEDCPVLVTNHKLDNAIMVVRVLQNLRTSKLVIVAPDFSDNVLVALVASFKSGFHCFPVKTPALRTEQYEDVALGVGAKFINKDTGMKFENIDVHAMGFLEKIVVKETDAREDAVVTGGKGAVSVDGTSSAVAERIKTLHGQIQEQKSDIHKKLIERRIANIASSVGVIRVGASTTTKSLYEKLKIEDAVYACRAALDEGYVEGGGLCLKKIVESMPENVLSDALLAPYKQIQDNADGTLEIGPDIIDPAKVVRLAVENAVEVAAHLITVKILIPENEEQGPGEGYADIAKALMFYSKMWARKEGLIKESELEIEKEQLEQYEEKLAADR